MDKQHVRCLVALSLFLVSLCAVSTDAFAGPWMRSEGDSMLSTGLGYSIADGFWKRNGGFEKYPDQHEQGYLYLHYEYGYSYYYTLFASTAWTYDDSGDSTDSGIDNIKVGIRGRLNYFRNGRTWELMATLPLDSAGTDPGAGDFGLTGAVFYRHRPDPYENPFVNYSGDNWECGTGITLWSGGIGGELWGYGRWDRPIFDKLVEIGAGISGRTSFAGSNSGGVDVYGPNDNYHYDEITGELSIKRNIGTAKSVRLSYKKDLWGRNIDNNEGIHMNFSMSWTK